MPWHGRRRDCLSSSVLPALRLLGCQKWASASVIFSGSLDGGMVVDLPCFTYGPMAKTATVLLSSGCVPSERPPPPAASSASSTARSSVISWTFSAFGMDEHPVMFHVGPEAADVGSTAFPVSGAPCYGRERSFSKSRASASFRRNGTPCPGRAFRLRVPGSPSDLHVSQGPSAARSPWR